MYFCMRLSVIFLIYFLLSFSTSSAQFFPKDKKSYRANFIEGSLLLEEGNPLMALEYFKFARIYDSLNANINYLVGYCYLSHPIAKHEAEYYLEIASSKITRNYEPFEPDVDGAPVITYYHLAHAYHLDYKFDKATDALDKFSTYVREKDKKAKSDIEHLRTWIKYARIYYSSPQKVEITNMGDSINDEMPDYSPCLSGDERTLVFSHRGKNNMGAASGEMAIDGIPYEDVVISYKKNNGDWTKPVSISPFINTISHDGAVSLSPDGQSLIVYKDDNGGDLFESTFDGKEWSMPVKFGSNINTEHWEPSACLSRDGNVIFFISDRPGGLGGKDIWKSIKLPNGQWSLATNLGPTINTPCNEESPFIGADGITFYFSSEGHQSMGGYDIMYSIIDDEGNFSSPINMMYPINTPDDDLYLVASPDNKRLYYASAHEGADSHGEKDIFMINYSKGMSNALVLVKGQIKPGPCDSIPNDIAIIVTNKSSNELVGTYRPQHVTGAFSVILTPGLSYNFSYQQSGIEILNEDIDVAEEMTYDEINRDIKLRPHNLCNETNYDSDSDGKEILLSLSVLSDSKTKTPLPHSGFKLYADNELYYSGKTDDNGKAKSILLEKNKDYRLELADIPNVKSTFTTKGLDKGKLFEKTLFQSGEISTESDIKYTLNILALMDEKSSKPIKNADVIVEGTDGSYFKGKTNEEGRIADIKLNGESNYEIIISKGNIKIESLVSTAGIKKSNTFTKVLYAKGGEKIIPDNSVFDGKTFSFFFKYNMNDLDEQAPEYVRFIDHLLDNKDASGKIKISIIASASKVPTKKFVNNQELAAKRAQNSLNRILSTLERKGITKNNVEVVSKKAIVSGPNFENDPKNVEKYEKFQYVKLEVKK
jgi:hypothetical protein